MQLPKALLAVLASRPRLAILTGAGVSAESGIPTFREAQSGLWARFSPQELATPEAFSENPQRVWDWYRWRRELVQQGQPNAAHISIAELQVKLNHCAIVTQNVDGLQQRAGATQVTELHGNLWRQRCVAECGHIATIEAAVVVETGELPHCPQCGELLRPDVVWFGETLPDQAMAEAAYAIKTADMVLVCGTSNIVYPAASLPLEALRLGKIVVEINPEKTPLSAKANYFLKAPASLVLPLLSNYLVKPST